MSIMTLRTAILLIVTLLAAGLSEQVTMIRAATLYDSGDPTPEEQLLLEYINRARADPTAEGTRLGINLWESLCDLNDVGVRPPLAMNKILLRVADYHSWDMYSNDYFGHDDLTGHNPQQRMTDAGYSLRTWGENIAVGSSGYSAMNLQDNLMVDPSTSCRLHRVNLFDDKFKEVGIGHYSGATPNPSGWVNFLTQDFGSSSVGPFLVGVVYNDRDDDNFYDIGEGISGVQITPSEGSYYAVSSTSGGYAFPIGTSGTIMVTASGSGFGSVTKTVSFNGANVKLDFMNIGNDTTKSTNTTITSATAATPTTITTTSVTIFVSMTSSAATSGKTSATTAASSTTTISTTEISEFQSGNAVILIAALGLYAAMRRKSQLRLSAP